jgi:hypothetical protein
MDPATIGLLISIAPTILDLLFGRGNIIKHETLLENPERMYGYGLEGYGYRYPPTLGYYEEPIVVGTITQGPFKGFPIRRYVPKVDQKWIAAYFLNKKIAGQNRWLAKAKEALQKASQEYLAELQKTDPKAYDEAMKAREKRLAKKGQLPLPLRAPQIKSLYDELYKIKDDEENLRQIYYSGQRVPRKKKKTVLVEVPAEQLVAKK